MLKKKRNIFSGGTSTIIYSLVGLALLTEKGPQIHSKYEYADMFKSNPGDI